MDRSFLKHALIYGLGNMLLQEVGVVLLPLYGRCFSKTEFGAMEILSRFAEIAAICLLFNGLRLAIIALYSQSSNDNECRRLGSSAAYVFAGVVVLGATGMAILAPWLYEDAPGFLRWVVLAYLLESASGGLLAFTQARQEATLFVALSLGQVLCRVGLSILLVAGLGLGPLGAITASVLTSAVAALTIGSRELIRGGWAFDKRQTLAMLRFALPFVPCGLCFFVLNNGDRFLLLQLGGEETVADYAFAYKLTLGVAMFSKAPLLMVWSPRSYQVARRADAAARFGQAFTWILAAYVFVGLGLCAVRQEIVALLGGPRYLASAAIIGPIVLAYYFLTWADLMDAGFYVTRRTGLKSLLALPSTAVMLALYLLLIPAWGPMGAALATLLGFAFHAALTCHVVGRMLRIDHQFGRMTAMLALAVGVWFLTSTMPVGLTVLPLKVGVCFLWPVLVWFSGMLTAEERDFVRSTIYWSAPRALAISVRRRFGVPGR